MGSTKTSASRRSKAAQRQPAVFVALVNLPARPVPLRHRLGRGVPSAATETSWQFEIEGPVSALVVASTPPPSRPLRPTLEIRRRAADTSGMHEATRARLEALLAGEEARPTALPPPRLGIVPGGTVDAARRLLRRQPSSPESSSFTRWGRGPSASADRPKRAVPGPAAQRRPRR